MATKQTSHETEENKTSKHTQNKSQAIDAILESIDKEIIATQESVNNETSKINTIFNEIRDYVNKREQYLLSQVQTKSNDKTQKLQESKSQFLEYQKQLNKKDSNGHKSTNSKDSTQETEPNIDTFTIQSNKTVLSTENTDTQNIRDLLSSFGKIIDISPPSPPIIEIISENIGSVQIKLYSTSKEIIKHKIEYAQLNDTDTNDDTKENDKEQNEEKLEWFSKETKEDTVTINALSPNKIYLIRASSMCIIGWSTYSNIERIKTKANFKDEFKHYNPNKYQVTSQHMVVTRTKGYDSVCYGSEIISSIGGSVYEWTFKILKRSSVHHMAIGIDEAPLYISKDEGSFDTQIGKSKAYVLWYNGNTTKWDNHGWIKSEENGSPRLNEHDKVHMCLDLKSYQLKYKINDGNEYTMFEKITTNNDINYCMAVYMNGKGDSIELVNCSKA